MFCLFFYPKVSGSRIQNRYLNYLALLYVVPTVFRVFLPIVSLCPPWLGRKRKSLYRNWYPEISLLFLLHSYVESTAETKDFLYYHMYFLIQNHQFLF